MVYVVKVICLFFFVCCLFAAISCDVSNHDREKQLSEIKELLANSKIILPEDSTFLNGGFLRDGYVFALLRCPEAVPMLFPNAREMVTASDQVIYDSMKAISRNHDMGAIIPGSAKRYEWTLGNDLWQQENLQTSKGSFVQIEVFKGKAN